MPSTHSVLVVGVGGQGVVLAGNILADVALAAGFDVKKSEVHGMSKRGGIVFSHVRYGAAVHSPLIGGGEADALVALEWAEGLRWRSYLRPDGVFVSGTAQIVPPAAHLDHRRWARAYPAFDRAVLADHRGPVHTVDALGVARNAGSASLTNTVLLGVLAVYLEFPHDVWEETIVRHVPARTAEMNVRAFREGLALGRAPMKLEPARSAPMKSAPARRPAAEVEITAAWCKGCDICVRVCPEHCLRLNDRAIAEVADAAACTGCRLCEYLCPDFAVTVRRRTAAAPAGTP
ncbi:MAG TPA: 2-oxoacid:acceptor oxidoreductase family protein [bacterium]|nr:2-oxoacid:acceptor oxidoreductase family protein [bacterium]